MHISSCQTLITHTPVLKCSLPTGQLSPWSVQVIYIGTTVCQVEGCLGTSSEQVVGVYETQGGVRTPGAKGERMCTCKDITYFFPIFFARIRFTRYRSRATYLATVSGALPDAVHAALSRTPFVTLLFTCYASYYIQWVVPRRFKWLSTKIGGEGYTIGRK